MNGFTGADLKFRLPGARPRAEPVLSITVAYAEHASFG
jgi:hypothetical protein